MDLITTTPELAAVCARLARHPVITVDTEFLRETTYYPLLCVVQMASADEAVVIDTLAPGIDLKPFFALMADEKVLKVFHAARQDIEIVWHQAGIVHHPIFDTQVAAMVLGYGDSIAYDQLVVGNGIAIAEHHGRDLGVEDRVGNDACLMPDDFDILTGGVENLQHLLVGHQREEWLEVDARSQRIDHDRLVCARHLHDAEQRIVGRLAQEFGINGDDRVPGQTGANRGEFRSGGNQIHERSITLLKGRSAESADMSRVLGRIRALHFRVTATFRRDSYQRPRILTHFGIPKSGKL